jgi:MFS family permease
LDPNLVILQEGLAVHAQPVGRGWQGSGSAFARYLIGVTLSFYGDWLTTVALVVLLYRLVGPAAPAGYMVARVLPRLLSGAPGGVLADRLPPHRLVAACALVQAALTLSIIGSARIGAVWAIYAAVALAQFSGGLARPCIGAMVPRVAPPQRLARANALFSLGQSSSLALGPALGAALLVVTSPETLLKIDAATFVVAAVLMLSLRLTARPEVGGMRRPGALAGFSAVWPDPLLRAMAAAWVAGGVAASAASSLLVLIARTMGSDSLVGYLYAAVGGGSVICGFVVLRYRPRRTTRDLIVGLAVLETVTLAVLTLHAPLAGAVLLLAASGGSGIVWQTWGATDMQMRTHPAVLGRVNAVMVTSTSLGMLIGALLALGLVSWVGWERALFISCCLALGVLAAGVFAGPQRAAPSLAE